MSIDQSAGIYWEDPRVEHGSLPQPRSTSRYKNLFDPVQLGPKVAPNRFYAVPYSTRWGMHQVGQEARHRGMRAEGGWGVVCTGETLFAPESALEENILWLRDDSDTAALEQVVDAIHEQGSLAGLELAHYGAWAAPIWTRHPTIGPSQVAADYTAMRGTIPMAMGRTDIRRVQAEWVEAAKRGEAAGFDVVYVLGAWSHLTVQFLSDAYNRRTDEYGGPIENRARFLLETITSVKGAVGDRCAIAVRISVDPKGPGGLATEDAFAFMGMADELVDLWDVCVGGYANFAEDITPSRRFDEGTSLDVTRRAREVTVKPIVVTGRFTNPDLMVELVDSGDVDLIGAARPAIADPFMPRKIAAERFDAVRECTGTNECIARELGGQIACTQNATVGEEFRRGWHPELFSRAENASDPVLVVGAGPAGLECATVLGRRGFEYVHLVDQRPKPGGWLTWFSRMPGFRPWARVVEHREQLLTSLRNVTFVPSKTLDLESVLDYGAAIVIVATGAEWSTSVRDPNSQEPISGADAALEHVLTPEQIMLKGKEVPEGKVVIYDADGGLTGLAMAQYLQHHGRRVDLVSPFLEVGGRDMRDFDGAVMRTEVVAAGGEIHPGQTLSSVDRDHITTVDEYGRVTELSCNGVVLVTHRVSETSLFDELMGQEERWQEYGIGSVFRIGDCVAPRALTDAVFDGHRLAREIDQDDPAVAARAMSDAIDMRMARTGARSRLEASG